MDVRTPTAVPVRSMNRAQVFAQGVYVGFTESVNAMKNRVLSRCQIFCQ
jgi:hypothetical protein